MSKQSNTEKAIINPPAFPLCDVGHMGTWKNILLRLYSKFITKLTLFALLTLGILIYSLTGVGHKYLGKLSTMTNYRPKTRLFSDSSPLFASFQWGRSEVVIIYTKKCGNRNSNPTESIMFQTLNGQPPSTNVDDLQLFSLPPSELWVKGHTHDGSDQGPLKDPSTLFSSNTFGALNFIVSRCGQFCTAKQEVKMTISVLCSNPVFR